MADPSWLTQQGTKKTATNTQSTSAGASPPSFKVILVGDVCVGKTTIFSRTRDPQRVPPETQITASIGVDTCTRTVCTSKGMVKLTVWDTAGGEQYRTLTRGYYRNTHAALLIFNLNDPHSLYPLQGWQREVVESSPSALHFLVGNKSDLDRQVTGQTMKSFADSHSCQAAFLTSAKTGEGVQEALKVVCEHLIRQGPTPSASGPGKERLWLEDTHCHVHDNAKNKHAPKCCS